MLALLGRMPKNYLETMAAKIGYGSMMGLRAFRPIGYQVSSDFFFGALFDAFKDCIKRYSICPLVLLNSSAAHFSNALSMSSFKRNANAFFLAMFRV